MASTNITADSVHLIPSAEPSTKKSRDGVPIEERCRALTQNSSTKKHTGPQCSRRKRPSDDTPQALKSVDELVADELCKQHQKMMERFRDVIVRQLNDERNQQIAATPARTSGPASFRSDNKAMFSGAAGPNNDQISESKGARLIEAGNFSKQWHNQTLRQQLNDERNQKIAATPASTSGPASFQFDNKVMSSGAAGPNNDQVSEPKGARLIEAENFSKQWHNQILRQQLNDERNQKIAATPASTSGPASFQFDNKVMSSGAAGPNNDQVSEPKGARLIEAENSGKQSNNQALIDECLEFLQAHEMGRISLTLVEMEGLTAALEKTLDLETDLGMEQASAREPGARKPGVSKASVEETGVQAAGVQHSPVHLREGNGGEDDEAALWAQIGA